MYILVGDSSGVFGYVLENSHCQTVLQNLGYAVGVDGPRQPFGYIDRTMHSSFKNVYVEYMTGTILYISLSDTFDPSEYFDVTVIPINTEEEN